MLCTQPPPNTRNHVLVNQLVDDEGVCRTAPTTQGLINNVKMFNVGSIIYYVEKINHLVISQSKSSQI